MEVRSSWQLPSTADVRDTASGVGRVPGAAAASRTAVPAAAGGALASAAAGLAGLAGRGGQKRTEEEALDEPRVSSSMISYDVSTNSYEKKHLVNTT